MPRLPRIVPLLTAIIGLALIAACAPKDDLAEVPAPLGDFKLGHNIVVADNAQLGPLSRRATPDELQTALQDAIGARMGRYTGDNFYHLGVNIDAYALALPGIPVVAKPKSILVVSVTVWDDLAGKKINAKQKQLYVFESTTPATFISSGLTQTKAVQLGNLSTNMARKIESWLRENEAWFGALPNPAETGAPAVAGGAPGIAPEAIEPVGTTVAPAALN